jgi:hypothetical protein
MKRSYIVLAVLLLSYNVFAQSVKPVVFHVDLVSETTTYEAMELVWYNLINDAQDDIVKSQKVIDEKFRKLIVLEEKTQEYQSNLQQPLKESLNDGYVKQIIEEIDNNQSWVEKFAAKHPEYIELSKDTKKYVRDKAEELTDYIEKAGKKTGNTGRLSSKERNDLNIYVLNELLKLKYVSQSVVHMLDATRKSED